MNVGGNELVVASDHELARLAAVAAGRALMALREEIGFDDPKRLRDEGDRTAHVLLMQLLAEQRPDDAVLSEEGRRPGTARGATGLDRGPARRHP